MLHKIEKLVRQTLIVDGQCLLIKPNSHGYAVIQEDGKKRLAHRIVAAAFHGQPQGRWALHKCDRRNCVNPRHLYWGTRLDNIRDAKERQRMPRGEQNWIAKLKNRDVEKLRSLSQKGVRQIALARRFGVHQSTVSRIINRKRYDIT